MDRLGLDEALLEVAVDLAGGLRGARALLDGPGIGALLVRRKEGNEVQHVVRRVDEAFEAGPMQAGVLQEELPFLRIELGKLRFQLRRDNDDAGVFLLSDSAELIDVRVAVGQVTFPHVGDVENRLIGQEKQFVDERLIGIADLERPGPVPVAQMIVEALVHLQVLGGILVALLRGRLHLLNALLDRLQVLQEELGVDHFHVAHRIDFARHVRHLVIFEAAHDVNDGVHFADIGEELIAQSLALGGAFHEAGNVDKLDGGGSGLGGAGQLGDPREPLVRNGHDAHVGVDRAERIVFGRGPGVAQCIEDRRLADVGEADEAALERHIEP